VSNKKDYHHKQLRRLGPPKLSMGETVLMIEGMSRGQKKQKKFGWKGGEREEAEGRKIHSEANREVD